MVSHDSAAQRALKMAYLYSERGLADTSIAEHGNAPLLCVDWDGVSDGDKARNGSRTHCAAKLKRGVDTRGM